MFEGTDKDYRNLFNKYIKCPRVDVFPDAKEKDWELYRKIGDYGILNPDINDDHKCVSYQIFSDIWNFMEFNEWYNHRLALINILHEYDNSVSIEDIDNMFIHNYELKDKVFSNSDTKEAYKKYYGNLFHDFDDSLKED